ncbi:hypothetical protein BAnh1_04150 [Bartonella australis AUST/NH1]|uniref:PF07598 family protein n=1 Tax=Bartonella australis (strain Aust/NH1) TaxID=1094489 RepID=M1PCF4_BARAA|nr:DUF1561 family protein [Bartonella australis]AGF74296.1 hypothetical protein BAnh1_04150 [Bartonella australis AUST/NH1]
MRYDEALLIGNYSFKKSDLKFLSLFCVFLLSFDSLFAAPIPKISQKLADEPIDKAIRVKIHNGWEYCYAPAFVDGESYVYINNCSSSSVQSARYDVFQRVAWKVKDVWLCMTAPGSVTGVGEKATANWDYIKLRPCVINDANQRWVIKNNAFYTADGEFRVKDHKWYAYISKNEEDYYNHILSSTMDKWVNTIATPGNMSLKTSLSWKFKSGSSFDMYYISDDGSKAEVFDLYYNPENGHIARYFPSSGLLSCIASQQSPSEDWNWVKWLFCNDNVPTTKDNGYWDVSLLAGREGPVLNRDDNFLRVTQYGSNWGRPYTVKPDYIKKDTANSPTSEFILDYDIERWNRYVMANVEDALPYCPAPGKKQDVSGFKQRVKRNLPSDFQLNEEWKRRLHAIAITRTRAGAMAGICGTCLLQTFQMIAELQETYPGLPRTSGGYFFDTAPNTDPIRSLKQRYPFLYRAIELATILHGVSLNTAEGDDVISVRAAHAAAQVALPNFDWVQSPIATDQSAIHASIRELFNAPVGTMWVGLIVFTLPNGSPLRHAVPILRSLNGIKVIPTNVSASFLGFSYQLVEATTADLVLNQLSYPTSLTVTAFATLRLAEITTQPLSVTISQNNCTGEGEERRGSRQLPRSALVNQCESGRCPL